MTAAVITHPRRQQWENLLAAVDAAPNFVPVVDADVEKELEHRLDRDGGQPA